MSVLELRWWCHGSERFISDAFRGAKVLVRCVQVWSLGPFTIYTYLEGECCVGVDGGWVESVEDTGSHDVSKEGSRCMF